MGRFQEGSRRAPRLWRRALACRLASERPVARAEGEGPEAIVRERVGGPPEVAEHPDGGPVTRWRAWRGVDRSRVSEHRDGGAWRGSASGELAAGAECQAVEGGGGVRARRQARPARRAGRRRRRRCRPASKPSPTTARSRRRTARRGSPCLWCRSRARPRECSPSAASCMPGCRSSGRALRRPSRSGRGPPETASETADGTSWWKRGRSDARDLAEAAALGLKLVRHDQPVALAIAKADRLELFQRCVDVYE